MIEAGKYHDLLEELFILQNIAELKAVTQQIQKRRQRIFQIT